MQKLVVFYCSAVCLCTVICQKQLLAQPHSIHLEYLEILLADSLLRMDLYGEAADLYAKIARDLATEDTLAVAYALHQQAFLHLQQKNWELANSLLSEASIICRRFSIYPNLEIARNHYYQAQHEYWQGEQEKAVDYNRKALEYYEHVRPNSLDHIRAVRQQGRMAADWRYLDSALYLLREHFSDRKDEIAITLYRMGRYHRSRDAPGSAASYLGEAVRYFEMSKVYPRLTASAYNILANAYHDMGNYRRSIGFYLKAIEISRSSMKESPRRQLTPLDNLALTYTKLQQYDSAKICYEIAGGIIRDFEVVDTVLLANHHQQYGRFYELQQRYDQALAHYQWALHFHRQLKTPKWIDQSRTLTNLAKCYLAQRHYDQAILHIEEALDLVAPGIRNEETRDFSKYVQTIDGIWEPLIAGGAINFHKFQATQDRSDLERALDYYILVDRFSDHIRQGPYSDETQLSVSHHFHAGAKGILQCIGQMKSGSWEPNLDELAFRVVEKNRYAEVLKHLLQRTQPKQNQGSLETWRETLSELTKEKMALEKAMENGRVSDSLKNRLFELSLQLDACKAKVRANEPHFFQVRYDSLLTLTEARNHLTKGQQLLEFFQMDSLIAVISITSDHSELLFIPLKEVEEDVRWIQKRVSHYFTANDENKELDFQRFSDKAYSLFRNLLEPFIDERTTDLVFSPDGALGFLPFEVLLTNPSGTDFQNAKYLIREYTISHCYGANLLLSRPPISPITDPNLLAFAYSAGGDDAIDDLAFSPLPNSLQEVTAINEVVGGSTNLICTGPRAVKSRFLVEYPDYEWFHFALHGREGGALERNSCLVFREESDQNEDPSLYAYELNALNLQHVRLATLSACNTGIGEALDGEGVFSIGRAFYYSGVPSVVMSLWLADDTSTPKLMKGFYQGLAGGHSIASALRTAKLDYLEGVPHPQLAEPYYWASFVLLGDVSPAKEILVIGRSILVILLGLLVVLGGFFLSKRRI